MKRVSWVLAIGMLGVLSGIVAGEEVKAQAETKLQGVLAAKPADAKPDVIALLKVKEGDQETLVNLTAGGEFSARLSRAIGRAVEVTGTRLEDGSFKVTSAKASDSARAGEGRQAGGRAARRPAEQPASAAPAAADNTVVQPAEAAGAAQLGDDRFIGAITHYQAIDDRVPRLKPPVPKLGAAGTAITDPSFGCRILRVTDGNTNPAAPSCSYRTPSGTNENPFNTDSTRFYVQGQMGASVVVFDFDAKNFTCTPLKNEQGGLAFFELWDGFFSHTNPNILYGTGIHSHTIMEYYLPSHTSSVVVDVDRILPSTDPLGMTTVDHSDTCFAVTFGGKKDRYPYLLVYNRKTRDYTILDVKESKVKKYGSDTFEPLNMQLGGGLHAAGLAADGHYADVTYVAGPGAANKGGHLIWDTWAGKVYSMPQDAGHFVSGFGWRISQTGSGREGFAWTIRALNDLDHPKQLVSPRNEPLSWGDSHPSWNNCRPGALVPFVTECYLPSRTGPEDTVRNCWEGEIIAVSTDGSDKVWRFCHHRASDFAEFWNTPRASVSQDGKYAVFTSNWEGTLGDAVRPSERRGGGEGKDTRQDVFLVELEKKQ